MRVSLYLDSLRNAFLQYVDREDRDEIISV